MGLGGSPSHEVPTMTTASPLPLVSATLDRQSANHAYLLARDGRTWDVYGDTWEEIAVDAAIIAKGEGLSIDAVCSSLPGEPARFVAYPSVMDMVAEAGLIAARGDAVSLRAYIAGLTTADAMTVDTVAESDWEGLAFDTWVASTDLSPTFRARVAARRAANLCRAAAPSDIDANPIVDIWYRDGSTARSMPARSMAWHASCGIESWAYTPIDIARYDYPSPHLLHFDSDRAYLMPRED